MNFYLFNVLPSSSVTGDTSVSLWEPFQADFCVLLTAFPIRRPCFLAQQKPQAHAVFSLSNPGMCPGATLL